MLESNNEGMLGTQKESKPNGQDLSIVSRIPYRQDSGNDRMHR